MSDKKYKEKYNEGCIKIFKLLELLREDKADYNDVIDIISGDKETPEKPHVTLNKYLNTLKVFGFKVYKDNKKFKSTNLPFGINLSINDLKAINILEKIQPTLPEGKNKKNLKDFIEHIKSRLSETSINNYNKISNNDHKDYSFYYSTMREQLERAEALCEETGKIILTYLRNKEEVSVQCAAEEVVYDNKNAYLKIYKLKENERENILVTNILSIEYMHSQKSLIENSKTVVFRLKGRLAKAYTLKDGEYVRDILNDGSIIVVNQKEPTNELIKRLMKYGSSCTVEGPADVKQKIIQAINNSLKNYE